MSEDNTDLGIRLRFITGDAAAAIGDVDKLLDKAADGGRKAQRQLDDLGKTYRATGTSAGVIEANLIAATTAALKFHEQVARGGVGAMRFGVQAKVALADVRAQIEALRASGGPFREEWIESADSLEQVLDRDVAAMGRGKAAAEQFSQQTQDATRSVGGLGGGLNSTSEIMGLFGTKTEQTSLHLGVWVGAARLAGGAIKGMGDDVADAMRELGAAPETISAFEKHLDRIVSYTKPLGYLVETLKTLAALRGGKFDGVEGGASSIGGVGLASQERLNEIAKLDQQVAQLDNRYRALTGTGKLNAEATAKQTGEYAALSKQYSELNAKVPAHVAAMGGEVEARKEAERQLEEHQRALDKAGREEEQRRARIEKTIAGLQLQSENEERLVAAIEQGRPVYDAELEQLAREKQLRDALQGAHGAEIAAITATVTKTQELIEKKEQLLRLEAALHGVGPTLDLRPGSGGPRQGGTAEPPPVDFSQRDSDLAFLASLDSELTTARSLAQQQIAIINRLAKDGVINQRRAAEEISEIHRQLADDMVNSAGSMIGQINGILGTLRSLGVRVSGRASNAINTAQGAYQLYNQIGSLAGTAYSAYAGAGATSAGSAAAVSGAQAAGVWAAVVMAIAHQLTTQGTPHGEALIQMARDGRLSASGGSAWGQSVGAQSAAMYMAEVAIAGIQSILDEIDGRIENLARIEVGRRGQGKRAVHYVEYLDKFGQTVTAKFKEIDDAIEFAIVQTLKTSDLGGLSEEVQAAIRNTTARTLEGLQADVEFGEWVRDLPLSDASREMNAFTEAMDRALERARALGIAEDNITAARRAGLERMRNDALNLRESPEQQTRRRIDEYNEAVAMLQARNDLEEARLEAEAARLRVEIELVRAEFDIGLERLRGRGAILEAEAGLVASEIELAAALGAALEATEAALERLRNIEIPKPITEEEREEAERRARRGRGGGGDRREGVRDAIRDSELAALGEVQRRLAENKEKWDEHAKAAGKNADLLGQIAIARERENQAIRAAARERSIDPWLGGPTAGAASPFAQRLRDSNREYTDLRAAGRGQTGIPNWQVDQAEANRNFGIGQEALASLGVASARAAIETNAAAATMNFLRDNLEELGLTVDDLAAAAQEVSTNNYLRFADKWAERIGDEKLLAELAEIRYDAEKRQDLLEIEMLYAKGLLLDAEYQKLLKLHGLLPDDLPVAGGAGGGGSDYYQRQQDAMDEFAQAVADAAKRWKESTDKLIDFQRSFLLSDLSPLSPQAQLDEAKRQYEETYAAARGGDLEARERYEQIARAYATEGKGYYATSEGYEQDIATRIQRDLADLIAQRGPYSIGNATFGAFERANAPVIAAVEKGGGETVTAVHDVADQISELRDVLAGSNNGGNPALEGKIERLADGIESLLRRIA